MIRVSKSIIGLEEIESVSKVLKKGFLGMGEEVLELENELSKFLNNNVICVSNGTAALQLALQSIGLKDGDEVLVQSLTYLASYQAISATGARPISCDVNLDDLTIDLNDAKSKLTSKTKAIMPVHYSGSPGNLNNIYKFAKEHNLRVVEDAAHAFGSMYENKLIGSFGDIICFSFDGIKNITCGEGGAVVTSDQAIINKVKDLRLLAVENDSEMRYLNKRSWDFDVKEQGWRYHMSNIMASIGLAQLIKFSTLKKKRQDIAKYYFSLLSNNINIRLLNLDFDSIVPHIFPIIIKNGTRDKIKNILLENNIQTGIHYKPNHLLSFYKSNNLTKTENIYLCLLTLPLHPDITFEQAEYISKIIINNIDE